MKEDYSGINSAAQRDFRKVLYITQEEEIVGGKSTQ